MKDDFFHKSHRKQRIALNPKWTDLLFVMKGKERRWFRADKDGILEYDFYLPVELVDLPGERVLRVRCVRSKWRKKDIDPTGYDERILKPSSDGFARVRFGYKGVAQAGRRYKVQAQIVGGPAVVVATGTHYIHWWRR